MIKLFSFLVFTSTAVFIQSAFAQETKVKPEATLTANQKKRKNVISGEFKLETGAKQKDPHETAQDAGEAYFKGLQSSIKSLAGGSVTKTPVITDTVLHYITAAYLLCSVNNGVCPYFLDSLLEVDVINARIDKADTCPSLRLFWKKYIGNDLESRHQYATKIGFLSETGDFNNRLRPKYIKCQATVKEARVGTMSDAEFFKQRYSNGSKLEAVNKTIEYLASLKAKKLHVFDEISNLR